jgi:trigger factor
MPLKTKVTELPDSRVRVDAEVPSEEVESSFQRAATALGRELRIPGFRKGKVPAPMVIQRVGREAVLEEAVRESLPAWLEQALLQAGGRPVGDPKLSVEDLPSAGEPLSFSVEIAVTPKAKLGRYKGLEVGKREPEVPAAAVDEEIDRLRDSFATVDTVDRPLQEGDHAVLDFVGTIDGETFQGGDARDYMVEIGSERMVGDFERQLVGARAGESRTVEIDFPPDYPAEELSGAHASFDVQVKDVKEKHLPPVDDDFVSETSEFETLAELRADIEHKLAHAQEHAIDDEFREAVIDAAVEEAEIDLPDDLVAARAEEMWERTEEALRRRNIDPEIYLKAAGRTREQVVEDAKEDAAKQLGRESVLEAVADAESIEVDDEELLTVLRSASDAKPGDAERVLERLKETDRDQALRRDLRLRKAAALVVENASAIDVETAKAREAIWTPEKEREGSGQLWTPGDDPPDPAAGGPARPPRPR